MRHFPSGRQPFRYAPERPTTGKVRIGGENEAAGAAVAAVVADE